MLILGLSVERFLRPELYRLGGEGSKLWGLRPELAILTVLSRSPVNRL